ncbi:hypothetical protein [Helicobacter brantae]|uniref:Uncharacterized protein n=1 Tax=Helicobacter brantae TaxID=375927 RepID=A0A3D8J402_9HELI|nr:hypothetical protein [Helicobacter brantae]RDU71501.1 hypothetical protein CQA58_02850 [Helicobacter brantae]
MKFKTFSLLYLSCLFMGIVFVFIFLSILSAFFEHNTYQQIVKYQIKHNAIYGSALNENYFSYRLELIKEIKPDIVAIGSSRVGQFKQKFFKTSFVAAANAGNSLAETYYFVEEMIKNHKPKLVILGIDPWWFNKKMPNNKYLSYQQNNGKNINSTKIFNALKIFFSNPSIFINQLIAHQTTTNPYTSIPSLGFRAITKSNGSFPDGSYLYFSTLSGISPAEDKKFSNSKERIDQEIFPFFYGEELDYPRIEEFYSLLALLKQHKIQVLTLTTPLSPTIYNVLVNEKKKDFAWLQKFDEFARKNKIFHFLNPHKLQTIDCEFYDGFHGGDIAYARILEQIAKIDTDMVNFLDLQKIQETIKTKRGHAYSDNLGKYREIDFLNIGCKK